MHSFAEIYWTFLSEFDFYSFWNLYRIVNRRSNTFNQLHIFIIVGWESSMSDQSWSSEWSELYTNIDSSESLSVSATLGLRDYLPAFTFDVDRWFTRIITCFEPSFFKHALLEHPIFVTEKQTGHCFKSAIVHSCPSHLKATLHSSNFFSDQVADVLSSPSV